MTEMEQRMALAMRARFVDIIEKIAGKPFAETKVDLPGMDIWRDYARAALGAMREPTEAMCRAQHPLWSLGMPMWDWWRDMIDVARGVNLNEPRG